MEINVYDILNKKINSGDKIQLGNTVYYLYFGRYKTEDKTSHFGLYLDKGFSAKPVVSEYLLNALDSAILKIDSKGDVCTSFITSSDDYIKHITEKVEKEISKDKDRYSYFKTNPEELKEEIFAYSKHVSSASFSSHSFSFFLEDYTVYDYCPCCKTTKPDIVKPEDMLDRSSFPNDYNQLCRSCYNSERY